VVADKPQSAPSAVRFNNWPDLAAHILTKRYGGMAGDHYLQIQVKSLDLQKIPNGMLFSERAAFS